MTDGRKKLPLVGPSPPAEEQAESSALVIDELKERIAQDPDDPGAWLELGGAYLDIDHYAEAAKALGRAVELDGDMVVARRSYAHVLSKLERRDEAVYQLVQAKRLAPDEPRILHELGVAFYDKGLYDKALKTLAVAQEHAPGDPMIGYAMGMAYEAKGETALAIAKYRSAVQSAPDMIEAHETLADALAAVGELEEAVTQLEFVLLKQRTNTRAALNLEVLRKALDELRSRRLLGQRESAVNDSALVQEAKLIREVDSDASSSLVRYRTGLAQLWAFFDDERASKLSLIIPDPVKAGLAKGRLLQVTVLSADGTPTLADFGTAITLTFLREAIGLPLTGAAHLYAELLRTREPVIRGDVWVGFEPLEVDGEQVFALTVQPAPN
ncbi:MAG: tetratricopeptide repeat protein [Polyangiaceae bacterium]